MTALEERTPHATGSLADRPSGSKVGLELPHEAANLHVTGAALYTDDLIMRTHGVLHAWPVQAPHARALITDLRVKPAYDVDGVVRVLTAEDVPGINDAGIKHDEPLFPSEVMFHGHAVCWVLSETLDAARRGAEAIEVDYEPLPSLMTLTEAIAQESFQGHQRTVSRGDAAAGLAEAAHRFAGEFEFGGQEHFYLETHSSLALVDENGQIFVQCSTQHPSETQEIVAHVLGLDSHAVTVQCLRMGGGFGGKEMQPHGFAAIAALGATLTGRPVRLRLNRTQDMTMSGKRHPFHASWEIGFDDDGMITGLRATLTSDGGWSLDLSEPVLARALCHIDNAYWIPNIEAHGRIAKTNKTSQTAFRGFGGPQGMIVIEDILGRCAPLLGLPAEELRRRNLYTPGHSTPYGQPVRHPERLADIWAQLLDKADYAERLAALEAFNAEHPHTKRGLAITPVKFGISFNLTAFNQAGALVHVYKDGSVLINHGGTEMGQGLHTKMIQVAATALGVPLSAVRLAPTRTDKVPNTSATAASSGADLNGGAIKNACDQIRERLAEVAARKLNIHPADVRFHDGVVTGIGFHDREISFAELAHAAYLQRVSLWAAGFYRTEGLHWDAERMQGEPFKYFAYGAALAEVEVDGFTGAYRFLRTDIVHDVGDSLSP
ncbi:MAG TPA: molybdopterin cofactor-binding domain-containing protein, partial [Microlunatus sp.]|nr:molybdopterin cofactor-binding domain-containing protein [Microlunatus sp.]